MKAKSPKKYLITWITIVAGYRTVTSLSKLTKTERHMVKTNYAVLFKAEGDAIFPIHLNGRLK